MVAHIVGLSCRVRYGRDHPLLDFRVHLFIKSLSGALKRCLNCNHYHSGKQDFCPDCGFPLFNVYKDDIRRCIGKISDGRLHWQLMPVSDDQPNAYYVLVDRANSTGDSGQLTDALSFDFEQEEDSLDLISNQHGFLRLQLFPALSYKEIQQYTVELVEDTHDHQYILHLVRSLLSYQERRYRRVLGFIDNRQSASRFSSVLRDDFASAFFEAFTRLHTPPNHPQPLRHALNHLKEQIPALENQNALEHSLFEEFDLWFNRYISIPIRFGGTDCLFIREQKQWTWLENVVLDIFLKERAIDKTQEIRTSQFIRFRRSWASMQRAISPSGGQSSDPMRPTIVLSAHPNAEYYPAVLRCGLMFILDRMDNELNADDATSMESFVAHRQVLSEAAQAANEGKPLTGILAAHLPSELQKMLADIGEHCIWNCISDLTQSGILRTYDEEPTHYVLNRDWLTFDPGHGEQAYDNYYSLREALLLTAEVHSSEVNSKKRAQIEKDFNNGDLQFLMSTPTLEMGIDIGALQTILCFGVPPMPSNYAQRAGRAGRGSGINYALIVTFCQEDSNHDMYYFASPEKMIAGRITPPNFNPTSPTIVKRHVNAWLLSQYAGSWRAIDDFCSQTRTIFEKTASTLESLFPIEFDLLQHITRDLPQQLRQVHSEMQASPRHALYASGIFPDYSFRRDEILLFDIDDADAVREQYNSAVWEDNELPRASRVPETAIRAFAPNEILFAGGEIYSILPTGHYDVIGSENGLQIREYQYFFGKKEMLFARKEKILSAHSVAESFAGESLPLVPSKTALIDVQYVPSIGLYFRNLGKRSWGGTTEHFSETYYSNNERQNIDFGIGYDLDRRGIILGVDAGVCRNKSYIFSLASALDRAIKDNFGLDDGELGVMIDVQPQNSSYRSHSEAAKSGARSYIVFYDLNGNGNSPLKEISECFYELVNAAYERLTHCHCIDGCYLCLKSYSTHHHANYVLKPVAQMFTGYLAGKERFQPSLSPLRERNAPIMEITMRLTGNKLQAYVNASREIEKDIEKSQNFTVFTFLTQLINANYTEAYRNFKLRTNLDYVVQAVNRGNLKKDMEAFLPFQFALLRFATVSAEKV